MKKLVMRGRQLIRIILLLCGVLGVGQSAIAVDSHPGALADKRVAKGKRGIAEAWLSDPTTRYRHFVLGSNYEAGSLSARLVDGRVAKLTLPPEFVFEDRQPRLADLDGDGQDEIIVVRSSLNSGAALVIVGVTNGRLIVRAETPPTGSANTWVNPAGIADFDGDGRLDIAFVQMPHVLGRLRVVTLKGDKLVQTATLEGVSNHVAGSPQLGLAAVADFNGDGVADLAIPSLDRRRLRFITMAGGLREFASRQLPAAAVSDFKLQETDGKPKVQVGLGGGRTVDIAP